MKRYVFVIFGLAACGSSDPVAIRVEVPVTPADQAVVVGLRGADGDPPLELQALAIDDSGQIDPLTLPFDVAQTIVVTALLYDRPLDTLGLLPGALVPAPSGAPSMPLPPTSTVTETTIVDDTASPWMPRTLPNDIASFRLETPDVCPRFEGRALSLGTTAVPAFVLRMDDRWSLVTVDKRLRPTETASVFFVDRDGNVVEQTDLPNNFYAGYQIADGRFWLGGQRGLIYEGSFTASPEPRIAISVTSTLSVAEDVIDLTGSPAGEAFEQFALTGARGEAVFGNFEWFDGASWSYSRRRNTNHDVTWVSPRYGLFASFFRDSSVQGMDDGVETMIVVSSVLFGSVVSIQQIPGVGLVAGTSGGEVHRAADGVSWRRVSSINAQPIEQFHGYDGGFAFLRGNTALGLYVDDTTRCDDAITDRPELVFAPKMTVVGRDVVVPLVVPGRGDDQAGEQFVAWFRRL